MNRIRLLVDSFADRDPTNAQIANAREIVSRLDPEQFHVSMFYRNQPDLRLLARPATRLIRLPAHAQTARILLEFLHGHHNVVFYLKASPASKWYMRVRTRLRPADVTIGTIESQSDLYNEPTIITEAIRLWEQTVLRCDYLVSNSQSVRFSLLSEYGLDSQIVPTGVDCRFWSPDVDRIENPRTRVLFVGSLRSFKGPHAVLSAARRFLNADFILVGTGILQPTLEQRVRRQQFSNVYLLGALGQDDLLQQYQAADIFLFPSRWEGSPKVLLEAAACGLPSIAFSHYRPETVLNGKTGFLVDSEKQMFRRLGDLLSNRDLRRSMGEAGRHHAKTFDWDVIVPRWAEIFSSVLAEKRREVKHDRAA